jgi:DNA-binding GntR family transcriptional regulator
VAGDPRKWARIADDVRARLDSRELKPGDRVRIEHEALEWGVTTGTAARALKHLESEGRLAHYPRYGYVVPQTAPASDDSS